MFRNIKDSFKRIVGLSLLASLGLVALLSLTQTDAVLAATAPPLGLVQQFGALGGAAVTGSAGAGTIVNGDVGSFPTPTISNFPPSSVVPPFTLHLAADGVVQQARLDAVFASLNLAAQGPGILLPAQLNGQVLTAGSYSFSSTADLAALGTLTLNGPGVFVFNVPTALTANVGSVVVGTADPCSVFWRVGTSATLNGNSFLGTVIADTGFITVGTGNVTGILVAATAVTMSVGGNTIGGCSIAPNPTLGKAFLPAAINAGGESTLTITLSNPNLAAANLTAPLIDTLPPGVAIAPIPNEGTTCGGVVTTGVNTVTLTGGSIPAFGSCTVTVNVTAPGAGIFTNTLGIGALVTDLGSNAFPASATLTVNPFPPIPGPPTLSKAFLPATIDAGDVSTLTLTLFNPNAAAAIITQLNDNLPAGVVIAPVPNAGNTCGGVVTAIAGTNTVTLTGGSIPALGSCTVTVNVTAPLAGSFDNTLNPGDLVTDQGNNVGVIITTLTVNLPLPALADIPTINEWGAIFFMVLAGFGSIFYLRKQKKI